MKATNAPPQITPHGIVKAQQVEVKLFDLIDYLDSERETISDDRKYAINKRLDFLQFKYVTINKY